MTITAHCLVKNEARFVWYSIMSVIDHVDKVLIYDTGSTDGTKEILKSIKKKFKRKVILSFNQEVTVDTFANVRQKMLDQTNTDWFLVVDADEVWWEDSIINVTQTIRKKGKSLESIVVPTLNLVGDMFHIQEEKAGLYKLAGRKGHLNLRAINMNIPGLASSGPHGTWGWIDGKGKMIQDRNPQKLIFLDSLYLHASFLRRAGDTFGDKKVPKRSKKLKLDLGDSLPLDFYFPEVFFRKRPKFVESVWETRTNAYVAKAILQAPLKKIRRGILPTKVGY